MTRKFPAASKLAMLLAAAALVALGSASASAQSKPKYDKDGRLYYGPNGPNRSYQQGPRTRVYVTTRSWLADAGTEVLRATASSRTTHSRRRTDTTSSRARTTIARSTASRSTRRQDLGGQPTVCAPALLIRQSLTKNARSTGHFLF